MYAAANCSISDSNQCAYKIIKRSMKCDFKIIGFYQLMYLLKNVKTLCYTFEHTFWTTIAHINVIIKIHSLVYRQHKGTYLHWTQSNHHWIFRSIRVACCILSFVLILQIVKRFRLRSATCSIALCFNGSIGIKINHHLYVVRSYKWFWLLVRRICWWNGVIESGVSVVGFLERKSFGFVQPLISGQCSFSNFGNWESPKNVRQIEGHRLWILLWIFRALQDMFKPYQKSTILPGFEC